MSFGIAHAIRAEPCSLSAPCDSTPKSPSSKWSHPESFYCPISQQCMHDPVILADGHTYERRHIERWLQERNTSPVSGLQLLRNDIIPNHALRNAIEEYFAQIFSVHRRAIRKTMNGPNMLDDDESLGSNGALLRTIDGLMQCSLLMNADLDTQSVLRQIMEEAKALVGAEVASVFLVDENREFLYSRVNSTDGVLRIPITAGIAGHVATTGNAVIVQDAYSDLRFNNAMDARTGFKTRNIMCVPLKSKKDGIIGVVQLINKTGAGVLNDRRRRASDDFLGLRSRTTSEFTADIILSAAQANETTMESPILDVTDFTGDDLQFLQVFASQAATAIAASGALNSERDDVQDSPSASTAASEVEEDVEMPKNLSNVGNVPQEACCQISAAKVLAQASEGWFLDAKMLDTATEKKPLSTLGGHLFEHLGLVASLDLDRERVAEFFKQLEAGYDSTISYHNSLHAASVMHAMYALLESGGLAETLAPALGKDVQLLRMSCLVAAAVHDYGHLGLSNDFLVKTSHERALRYNDEHANEHHHAAAALAVLSQPECNFLHQLSREDFRWVRTLVIKLVIGTDMAGHGDILKSLSELKCVEDRETEPVSEKQAWVLLQGAMKCADLGHLTLKWEDHLNWVQRLEHEFFSQGDQEKEEGLSVSFLMDRDKPGVTKTQVGFFDFVVLPFFRTFASLLPAAHPLLEGVEANRSIWFQLDQAVVAELEASVDATEAVIAEPIKPVVEPSDISLPSSQHLGRRRSGRARQRASKYWSSVRCRTPSPDIWDIGA